MNKKEKDPYENTLAYQWWKMQKELDFIWQETVVKPIMKLLKILIPIMIKILNKIKENLC